MLLKLTELIYNNNDTYKIDGPILIDTTGIYVDTIKKRMSTLDKTLVECSYIRFDKDRSIIVKETIAEIWAMVQQQEGQKA